MAKQQKRIKKTTSTLELSENDIHKITLTASQTKYLTLITENDITFCYGPAGTSKTFTACLSALKLYVDGKVNKIILSKPVQESGEKLGFLPGDVKEKIDPFVESYKTNLLKLLKQPTLVNWLEEVGVIEYRPLAYMRGATFDNCIMILDEAQNANFKQLMLFVTRMGKEAKAVVCGDVSQSDITKELVALPDFIKLVKGIPGVAIHQFKESDQMRKEILIQIIKRYEHWKNEYPDHRFLK